MRIDHISGAKLMSRDFAPLLGNPNDERFRFVSPIGISHPYFVFVGAWISMSCQMIPRVSSAAAPTEFHSLSPPCVHSADTPGPLIDQPGALAAGKSR